MTRTNPKQAAPMPKKESSIIDNPMRLYTYLVCISGLADCPDNTRMFRQKDLTLTKIQETTGITPKTAKLYLYYLEQNGLIKYRGDTSFNFVDETVFEKKTELRKAKQDEASRIWKYRNKYEKTSVYHIPRPIPYTPVPEITLERLNNEFNINELELKIYLLCCSYRDTCVNENRSFKVLTFEKIRDTIKMTLDAKNNAAIRGALAFLYGVGLIDYTEGAMDNRKGCKIPCFKLKEVYYYISDKNRNIDFTGQEEEKDSVFKEIQERIENGFYKIENLENNIKI